MTTHAQIAYDNEDGNLRVAYCQFDGMLSGLGTELVGMDFLDAMALVEGGDMCAPWEPYSLTEGLAGNEAKTMKSSDEMTAEYKYIYRNAEDNFGELKGWEVQCESTRGEWVSLASAIAFLIERNA